MDRVRRQVAASATLHFSEVTRCDGQQLGKLSTALIDQRIGHPTSNQNIGCLKPAVDVTFKFLVQKVEDIKRAAKQKKCSHKTFHI